MNNQLNLFKKEGETLGKAQRKIGKKQPMYTMHKYWAKKPYYWLRWLIHEYTQEGDLVVDPFLGSGITGSEAIIAKRHFYGCDINPIAVFISQMTLRNQINLRVMEETANQINNKLRDVERKAYKTRCPSCGTISIGRAYLRTRDDKIRHVKALCNCCRVSKTYDATSFDKKVAREFSQQNGDLNFPRTKLIPNSRLNIKEGTKLSDLFTKRNRILLNMLWDQILQVESSSIRDLLTLAFTANIANVSKLVPPITSRGKMSAGAWMTGFYVPDKYLEQNVLHYFKNRVNKVIKGKAQTNKLLPNNLIFGDITDPQTTRDHVTYEIEVRDSTNLPTKLENKADLIFADPPYGDTVPYLEQSVLWNAWLSESPEWEKEIVVSDSKLRTKGTNDYKRRLKKAFQAIHKSLKSDGIFALTFHSLYGEQWHALMEATMDAGFDLRQVLSMDQKTSTPRQLNRPRSLESDLLMIWERGYHHSLEHLDESSGEEFVNQYLQKEGIEKLTLGEIIKRMVEFAYAEGVVVPPVNLANLIEKSINEE